MISIIMSTYISQQSFDNRPSLSSIDANIVFDGNSLTEGINGSGVDQYFPKEVRDWMLSKCNSVTFNSFGVGGQTIRQMIADASTQIDSLVNVSKTNIIVVNEDANDIIVQNQTAAQNYANIQSYINARYAAGWDYVILWTGWYPRLPYDLYQPTQSDLDN